MTAVIWLSGTVASVVAAWVIRFGNTRRGQPVPCSPAPAAAGWPGEPGGRQPHGGASSQVSVMCSL